MLGLEQIPGLQGALTPSYVVVIAIKTLKHLFEESMIQNMCVTYNNYERYIQQIDLTRWHYSVEFLTIIIQGFYTKLLTKSIDD